MKMRRPHAVPLSRQVLVYLGELYALTGPDGYVLPAFLTSRRPMSENTINQAFGLRGGPDHSRWAAHDRLNPAQRKRQVESGRD